MLSRITLFTAVLAICGGLFTVGGIVVPIKDAHAGKYGNKDKKCPKPARYRTKDGKCVASGVRKRAGIKAYKARTLALQNKAQADKVKAQADKVKATSLSKYDNAIAAGKKVKASGGSIAAVAKAYCAISEPLFPIGSAKDRLTISRNKSYNAICKSGFLSGYIANNW